MDTRLRCVLLDDELPGLTYLKMLCERLPGVEVVKAFNSPETLLRELPTLDFDLCILDIDMPGMNGLQVAELLGGRPVIFTTAYHEYAAEAFDLDAIDYVRKPVRLERLEQALRKVAARVPVGRSAAGPVSVNTDRGKALLHPGDILLARTAENDSRDKEAWLRDGTKVLLKNMTFDRLMDLFEQGGLLRVSKREAIALSVLRFFDHDTITTTLLDGDGRPVVVSLGESYRAELLRRIGKR
ncbi:MAG: response regulator transcription factor [Flavobacteriales bacterium]|nr:response regulator transcription factor [Flavobacteriales bacterium]